MARGQRRAEQFAFLGAINLNPEFFMEGAEETNAYPRAFLLQAGLYSECECSSFDHYMGSHVAIGLVQLLITKNLSSQKGVKQLSVVRCKLSRSGG